MLQFIQPREKYLLNRGVVDREAVIAHLRLVLISLAMKGEYSKFYIGISNDLDTRILDHRVKRPDFKLMVPIFEEPANLFEGSFDRLERDAIAAFRAGITHPDTQKLLLRNENGPGGASPKRILYILVG